MPRFISAFLLLTLVVSADPAADRATGPRQARVVMPDQSELIGEITALEDGTYQLRSRETGEVVIVDGKVESITYLDEPSDADQVAVGRAVDAITQKARETGVTEQIGTGIAGMNAELARLEAKAAAGELTDEELARLKAFGESGNPADLGIEGFGWLDSSVLDVLADPEVAQAIEDGNYLKLMTNAKIQQVADESVGMRQLVDIVLQRPPRDPAPAPVAKPTAPTAPTPADAAPADEPTAADAPEQAVADPLWDDEPADDGADDFLADPPPAAAEATEPAE